MSPVKQHHVKFNFNIWKKCYRISSEDKLLNNVNGWLNNARIF